jgi:hypothetical protein
MCASQDFIALFSPQTVGGSRDLGNGLCAVQITFQGILMARQ